MDIYSTKKSWAFECENYRKILGKKAKFKNEKYMIETTKNLIRTAREGDCAEIANFHLNSWREAYTGLLPPEFLDQLGLRGH